jgi:hypothetical protein
VKHYMRQSRYVVNFIIITADEARATAVAGLSKAGKRVLKNKDSKHLSAKRSSKSPRLKEGTLEHPHWQSIYSDYDDALNAQYNAYHVAFAVCIGLAEHEFSVVSSLGFD